MQRELINLIIGRNIRYQRRMAGLSQKALGEPLGITFQQVQKYEKGTNAISCDKLIEVAGILRCSINALMLDALETIEQKPAEGPWNPYRVHTLITQFNRIDSRKTRQHICNLVRDIADLASIREENHE